MTKFDGDSASVTLSVEEEPPDVPLSSLSTFAVLTPSDGTAMGRVSRGRIVSLSPPPSSPPRYPRGNPQTRAFRKTFFAQATDQEWNDWRWQSRNRSRDLAQVARM